MASKPQQSTPPERLSESGIFQRLSPELERLLRGATEVELRELVESGALMDLVDADD